MACPTGGGTSSPKPGVGAAIYISSAAAGALLNNIPVAWAVPLAAFIGANTYEATQFCGNDPPADPGITALDVANLFANIGNPGGYLVSAEKVAQLVARYAWYVFCQCDGVGTPAPPAPPAAPANMPTVQDTAACQTIAGVECDAGPYPGCGSIGYRGNTWASTDVLVPSGAVTMRVTTRSIDYGQSLTITPRVQFFTSAHAQMAPIDLPVLALGTSQVNDVTVPSGAAFYHVAAYDPNVSSTDHVGFQASVQVFCGGSLDTNANCCAELRLTIEQIFELLQIMQRQLIPFAFVDGPAHAGLTGVGHFDISESMVGIRVESTVPPALGSELGDPLRIFDLGFVALGDADGWFGERRLSQADVLWAPRWTSAVTRIGYTLAPGATATITELRREA